MYTDNPIINYIHSTCITKSITNLLEIINHNRAKYCSDVRWLYCIANNQCQLKCCLSCCFTFDLIQHIYNKILAWVITTPWPTLAYSPEGPTPKTCHLRPKNWGVWPPNLPKIEALYPPKLTRLRTRPSCLTLHTRMMTWQQSHDNGRITSGLLRRCESKSYMQNDLQTKTH